MLTAYSALQFGCGDDPERKRCRSIALWIEGLQGIASMKSSGRFDASKWLQNRQVFPAAIKFSACWSLFLTINALCPCNTSETCSKSCDKAWYCPVQDFLSQRELVIMLSPSGERWNLTTSQDGYTERPRSTISKMTFWRNSSVNWTSGIASFHGLYCEDKKRLEKAGRFIDRIIMFQHIAAQYILMRGIESQSYNINS